MAITKCKSLFLKKCFPSSDRSLFVWLNLRFFLQSQYLSQRTKVYSAFEFGGLGVGVLLMPQK